MLSNKARPWRIVVLTAALAIVGGIVWIFVGGVSDKEGRIKVALTLGKAREVQAAIERYFVERKSLPPNNDALRVSGKTSEPYRREIGQIVQRRATNGG